MVIIGAKGLAKELLEILHRRGIKDMAFFDDVNKDMPDQLFGHFPVLKSMEEVGKYFNEFSNEFIIGVGNPAIRKMLCEKFENAGGKAVSLISDRAEIGSFENIIEEGTVITSGTILTNSIVVKKGALINLSSTVGHDSVVGAFSEICPNVSISGHCTIGDGVFLGTSATILPNITIGNNSVIAAGSVVTKDVPENVLVAGIPAVIKKNLQ